MSTLIPRALLVAGIGLVAGLFHWVYVTWLHPTFGYMGFAYEPPEVLDLALMYGLCVAPSFWMSMRLTRPSQLIVWVLYLAVFIPSTMVPLFAGMQDLAQTRTLMLVLFAGFAIVSWADRLPLLRLRRLKLSPVVFWSAYWILVAVLLAWVVEVFRGRMQFVGMGDVYERLRFESRDVAQGTGVNYAVMWLSGALMPFLLSWSLWRRRLAPFCFGIAVLVLLYTTAGLKSILTSAAFTPLLYVLMAGQRVAFGLKLVWLTVVLFAVLNTANLLVDDLSSGHLLFSAIVFARTFGGPGLLTAMYHDFFDSHPLTYYSHVNGINKLIPYPYESGLGMEVGYFYSRNLELNANAHLWCTDGLAALGLPGILLISVGCLLLFWILDSVSANHPPAFAAAAVAYSALNLSNASIFTTLLSGGLIFTILILYLMPVPQAAAAAAPPPERRRHARRRCGAGAGLAPSPCP